MARALSARPSIMPGLEPQWHQWKAFQCGTLAILTNFPSYQDLILVSPGVDAHESFD
jgi:hypothetical protein